MHRFLPLLLLVLLVGCLPRGAESPPRATARGVILTIARGVQMGDTLCAKFAKDTKSAALAGECADIYDVARPSLIGAEAAVDGWNDADKGRIICLAVDSISALHQFAAVLSRLKIALPAVILDALELADQFKGMCPNV